MGKYKSFVTAGGAHFRICSANKMLLDATASVFDPGLEASGIKLTIDLDDQPARESFEQAVAESIYITTHAILACYSDHLFIEGVAVVRSDGARILIVGTGYRGKTTLAVAGAVGGVWKIVSEDIVVFESSRDAVLSFVMPMALRPGSFELIQEATGIEIEINYGRWVVDRQLFWDRDLQASFDIALILQETSVPDSPFMQTPCSKEQFVRASIEYGNVLQTDSVDRLCSILSNARCYVIRNGTLNHRVCLLRDLCTER